MAQVLTRRLQRAAATIWNAVTGRHHIPVMETPSLDGLLQEVHALALANREFVASNQALGKRLDEVLHRLNGMADLSASSSSSAFDYPARYAEAYPNGARPIEEQIKVLGQQLELETAPALAYARSVAARSLPEGAEGWFACVDHERAGLSYWLAVERMLVQLETTFYGPWHRFDRTYFTSEDNSQQLQPDELSHDFFRRATQEQDGPIVIVPAQFGKGRAGRSGFDIRSALSQSDNGVFGLGFLAVCCMAITHPERFAPNALGAGCPGDRCSYIFNGVRDGDVTHVPGLNFGVLGGRLFQVRCDSHIMRYHNMGMVTGFLSPDQMVAS